MPSLAQLWLCTPAAVGRALALQGHGLRCRPPPPPPPKDDAQRAADRNPLPCHPRALPPQQPQHGSPANTQALCRQQPRPQLRAAQTKPRPLPPLPLLGAAGAPQHPRRQLCQLRDPQQLGFHALPQQPRQGQRAREAPCPPRTPGPWTMDSCPTLREAWSSSCSAARRRRLAPLLPPLQTLQPVR